MKYLSLTLITLIVSLQSIFGQFSDIKFRHISIQQGLSHDAVYSVTQDQNGIIWVGTQNGLNKFDGYNFHTYYHDPEDSCSLISANFGVLFRDSKNRIWIGTYRGGLSCYDEKNKTNLSFTSVSDNTKTLSSNLIRGIAEDRDGTIWITCARGGLCKYNEKTKDFKRYSPEKGNPNSISNNNCGALAIDFQNNIWIGTTDGLNRLNTKTNEIKIFRHDEKNPSSISSSSIQALYVDKHGRLFAGTRTDGFCIFNADNETFTTYKHDSKDPNSLSDNRVQAIFEDSNGTYWIGTYNGGIDVYNPEKGSFKTYMYENDNPESLSFNTVESIFEDNAKNLWIATRGGGLNIVDLKPEKFVNYKYNPKNPGLLSGISVMAVCSQNEQIIWFGTNAGLSRVDRTTNSVKYFYHDDKNQNSLSNDRIRSLFADSEGTVWVGTYQGGFDKIEENNGKFIFKHFTSDKENSNSVSSNQINIMIQDNQNRIWIGTNIGLDCMTFDETGKPHFEHFVPKEKDKTTLANNYISSVFCDNTGQIWIGTAGGLCLYNEKDHNFKQYINQSSDAQDLDINTINVIFQDSKGHFWIGTDGAGLYKFNPEDGQFKKYSDEFFKNGSVLSILEDHSKNLWLSTGKGLTKFNLEKKQFSIYGITEGLEETGFNRNSCIRMKDSSLYFGNISGFTLLKPEKIVLNQHIPNVVLSEFKIFNESFFTNQNSFCSISPQDLKSVTLSHKDYVISFEFASLDFTNTTKNRYMYKMEGFNDEWIDLGTNRYAMFTSLPSGHYIFRVKATNNDGIWSNDETSLAINVTVKPPFWQTAWFLSIIAGILIFAVYFIIRLRTRKLKIEKEVLEFRVHERTKEVEAQKEEILEQSRKLELSNSELEKLSVVARETENAVAILDQKGEFLWVNEGFTRMYGYTFEEFTKTLGSNILEGNFNNQTKNTVKKILAEKKTIVDSNIIVSKTGSNIWLQTTWTPILDENKNLVKIFAIDSDITSLKNAESEIRSQKDILLSQNQEINRQNEHIQSSIRYAKTIQNAILPFKSRFDEFSENFILYKPKDIVSGDFYWYSESYEYRFVAAVDCTGHGVPGAFMSLIANSLLNEIVNEKKIWLPRRILSTLNDNINKILNQKETDNRDGLDMCFVRISKIGTEKREVVFGGAKRDLYYYIASEKKLLKARGSRKSAGGVLSTRSKAKFSNTALQLGSGDILYLSTDGYIDQNNKNRNRFGTQKLMMVLNEIAAFPMDDQKDILSDILAKYQGEESQRDDITVIGLKLK
jgi:PAS domain S-box-containing protein